MWCYTQNLVWYHSFSPSSGIEKMTPRPSFRPQRKHCHIVKPPHPYRVRRSSPKAEQKTDPACAVAAQTHWTIRSRAFFRLIWLLVLASLTVPGLAQSQYGYEVWTADDGLPQNLIRGIDQTADGYLWIATLDGLVRFDGVRFTIFNKNNTPGIASNRFRAMYQDKKGGLWLCNEAGGVTLYREGKFRTYGIKDGIPGYVVDGLTGDDEGHFWVLSGDKIASWDEKKDRFTEITPNIPNIHYHLLLWDNAGFWGQDGKALVCFSKGHFITYPLPQQFADNSLWAGALDQNGVLWLETLDGRQARIASNGSNASPNNQRLPEFIYRETDGRSWTIRVGRRLSRTLEFESSGKLVTLPVTHLYTDRQQNLWAGTEGQGLFRLQQQTIHIYPQNQGLDAENVYPIYQDRSGAVWFGAWNTGLSRLSDGRLTSYTVADGLPNPLVTAIDEDKNGRLLVGTHGGLRIFNHGRFEKPLELNLPDGAVVQAMLHDDTGNQWFGTNHGLFLYRSGVTTPFTTKDGLAADDVRVIVQNAAGDLWIGGYGGLSHLQNGHFTHWTEKDGLPSNNVRSIYFDSDGTLWIGTYDGGLARFKNNRFTRYTVHEGLFNNGAFQILEDTHGNFWISCNRGIYRVSKKELNELADGVRSMITSVAYGKIDGMLNVECNGGLWPAGIKTRDGRLWFPTQDGVAVINPEEIIYDLQPPPVVIESALVGHVPAAITGPVRIAPDQENLEIQYTALSFIRPDQLRFKYQLDGLDSTWIDAGSRRTAYYSHIPPGKYVFRVIASNRDGVWSTTAKNLPVTVLAPFYKTWWFATLAAIAAVILITLAWRFRAAQLEHIASVRQVFARQLIASQESERKRIAAEMHDSLGQRLAVIKNLAHIVRRSMGRDKMEEENILITEEISSEAALAIQETREIAYNLRPFQLDRLGLSKAIEGMVDTVSRSSGIRIFFEIDNIDTLLPDELQINLYRIAQEALNNIVKHSGATEATIRILRTSEGLTLTVRDDGKGFAPASRSSQLGHSGFGLTGMAERANLLDGEFSAQSVVGSGTLITVRIPQARKSTREGQSSAK